MQPKQLSLYSTRARTHSHWGPTHEAQHETQREPVK